ncbi:MAG: RNA polymerase factor sigma-54 [Gammaproteobacteria bacterium]|nr:MAG: RNA polymerase factor sigma-54 [Gammaproteobacteria bacterium]
MKPTLQLRIGQQLTMTPQLQQAIRLLQLSSLELQAEIQEALEANPLLESTEDDIQTSQDDTAGEVKEKYDEENHPSTIDIHDALAKEVVTKDLPVDTQWDDWDSTPPSSGVSNNYDKDLNFEFQGKTTESLQDHLLWQMQLTPFSERDMVIATAIIDSVSDNGYLNSSLDDIRLSVGNSVMPDVETDDEEEIAAHLLQQDNEIIAVLHRIQHFDPLGVASRDLAECLLVQLAQFEDKTSEILDAEMIIRDHFEELGARNYKLILRKTRFSEERLKTTMRLIQSLNPRPGDSFSSNVAEYVTPDVYAYKEKGQWVVELSSESAPKIRINQSYANLIKRADTSPDNTYLQNNLQEARWFIKSILSRNETLLNVSKCIVDYQMGFFEYGEEAMRPLVLADIAEQVEMHESTISRVTTKKYMHTPAGIFELKYFFSSHVATSTGGECSSTAIKALIRKLVAAELTSKPLSDSKIATILEDQGIKVARRTVAKYREAMSIPPSNERKTLL